MILSNTRAQTEFNKQYQVGILCNSEQVDQFCAALISYKNDRSLLEYQRNKNWQLAHDLLNWETESSKLLDIIK